ncbi:LacI family DNA-binding transcriptional regulator [Cohnella sp. CFH 77786]|uniref:LacI family DNA-binding transcriptional regulator n=1 Tax=Cohnella sp. CFH 77786 TaxID=2662265 RepID=UPI001C610F83|nr:LacI family DNA-binding transcriptional regulator [Cohnella sp. CFH 77786]MBW5448213.1 LacI family DNA-binding transcriptional regulator [Cohnella sp. CFH 77786]
MAKLTMKEIAKKAKVSQPTVSRVLNGHKGVSEEIVKAVMKVVEEFGYVPNKAAQTLKRSSTNIIGISIREINNPYFVEIIDSLELEARKNGFNILFHNSKYNPVTEWENIQNFVSRQVDGIIIVPSSDFNLERISKLEIPAVVLTNNRKMLDSVGINHFQAGQLAGESFIHSGHKTFGYIGSIRDDEKFYGLESVLQENGFTFDSNNFLLVESSNNSFMIRRYIEKYLDKSEKLEFTCLFAENDIMALEFMRAAQQRQIRVPEDVSIIGFDDTYLSKIMEISSIHQPIGEMVKTSFEILLNRIHQEVPSSLVNIMMEPTLIERKSSKFRRR